MTEAAEFAAAPLSKPQRTRPNEPNGKTMQELHQLYAILAMAKKIQQAGHAIAPHEQQAQPRTVDDSAVITSTPATAAGEPASPLALHAVCLRGIPETLLSNTVSGNSGATSQETLASQPPSGVPPLQLFAPFIHQLALGMAAGYAKAQMSADSEQIGATQELARQQGQQKEQHDQQQQQQPPPPLAGAATPAAPIEQSIPISHTLTQLVSAAPGLSAATAAPESHCTKKTTKKRRLTDLLSSVQQADVPAVPAMPSSCKLAEAVAPPAALQLLVQPSPWKQQQQQTVMRKRRRQSAAQEQ
jgi:hypothetical protein